MLGQRGESGEPGGDDGGEPVGQWQRLGIPAPSRGGVGGDHLGQLDQRHRIPGRLAEHLPAGAAAERPGLLIEQPAGFG